MISNYLTSSHCNVSYGAFLEQHVCHRPLLAVERYLVLTEQRDGCGRLWI